MAKDFLGKSVCCNCRAEIEANDDRVVVMAVEVRGEEAEPAGRADSYSSTFCNKCAADVPEFTLPNPWKFQSDFLAAPSAGRRSGDLMARAESFDSMTNLERQKVLSDQEREDSRPPDKTDIAIRAQKFLCGPKAQKLGAKTRAVGALVALGLEQGQVAEFVGVNRSTVSREWDKVLRGVQKA